MVVKVLIVNEIKEFECCGMMLQKVEESDKTHDILYRPNQSWLTRKVVGNALDNMLCGSGMVAYLDVLSHAPTQVLQTNIRLCHECALKNGVIW